MRNSYSKHFQYRFIFMLLSIILGKDALSEIPKDSSSRWKPYLETLNRIPEFSERAATSHSSNYLNTDLLRLYDDEMATISAGWTLQTRPMHSDRAITREAENQYFHSQVSALNNQTIVTLEKSAQDSEVKSRNYRNEASQTLKQALAHSVAKRDSILEFENGNQIGFCFGRAMLIHYLLLQKGVPQKDISKIFVLGDLKLGAKIWRFHVAVLVPDESHGFLVIDPLEDEVLPYKLWIDKVKALDIKGRLSRARFYVTDPRKFLATSGMYAPEQLNHPALKAYFDRLVHSLL